MTCQGPAAKISLDDQSSLCALWLANLQVPNASSCRQGRLIRLSESSLAYRSFCLYCAQAQIKVSCIMTKPTKWHVRPAKTQISLGVHPVWSVFAVRMKKAWVLSCPLSTHRRPYQTGRMPRLMWVFVGCTSFCWFCHEAAQVCFTGSFHGC